MRNFIIKLVYYIYRPIFAVFIVINTAIFGVLVFIVSFFDPKGNIVHFIGKSWSRFNIFFSGVRIKVTGLENLVCGQPYIIISNHQSAFDIWALIGYLPLQLRWVMKIELRKVPLFGICCERMGHIYIDRGDSMKARESLEVSGKKIRSGSSVIFFAEGTRSRDGKLLPFKKGGFVIALVANVPILPITITGGKEVLPTKSLKLMPGIVKIIIHKPISVEGYTYETKESLMKVVRKSVELGLGQG